MLITLAVNYFVLHKLQLYDAILVLNTTMYVGVENRNNDTVMCGPMKVNIRDLNFASFQVLIIMFLLNMKEETYYLPQP